MSGKYDRFGIGIQVTDDDRVRVLTNRIEENSQDRDAYKDLGFIFSKEDFEKKDYSKAIEYLNKAINLGLDNLEIRLKLGAVLLNVKEYDKARLSYNKAVEFDPSCAEAYRGLVVSLFHISSVKMDYINIKNVLQKAIEVNPSDPELHYRLGLIYEELKSFNKAVTEYKKTFEIDPTNSEAYTKCELLYIKQKHKKKTAIVFASLIVVILASVFFIWQHRTTGQININYSMYEAERIEIDGKKYNTGFIRLKKGSHNITVRAKATYVDTTMDVVIKGNDRKVIPISLRGKKLLAHLKEKSQKLETPTQELPSEQKESVPAQLGETSKTLEKLKPGLSFEPMKSKELTKQDILKTEKRHIYKSGRENFVVDRIHDLEEIHPVGTPLRICWVTGNPGGYCSGGIVSFFVSPDKKIWTQIGSERYPKNDDVDHTSLFKPKIPFRYVKVSVPNNYCDFSSAEVNWEGSEKLPREVPEIK